MLVTYDVHLRKEEAFNMFSQVGYNFAPILFNLATIYDSTYNMDCWR